MHISKEELAQIAYLARLQLRDDELESSTQQIDKILSFIAQLSEVNTDAITPMAHPLSTNQRLREDKITETDKKDPFQDIAPKTKQGFYLVPTVIE